jgi:flagellar basal body-associated protein FliL
MCAFCGQILSTDASPASAKTQQKGKRGVGIILACGTIMLLLVGTAIVMWLLYPDSLSSMFAPSRPSSTFAVETEIASKTPKVPEAESTIPPTIAIVQGFFCKSGLSPRKQRATL